MALTLRVIRSALVSILFIGPLIPLCAIGCGNKGPKLHPASGKVLYEGTAAEGAVVVFQPVDSQSNALMPSGTVGADGSFQLTTHPHGEGAPAGEYIVLVTWYPPDARQSETPTNLLPERYSDAAQPQLRATIKAGNNQLETFVLTK